jgi:NDP-sugar pyrophosphorylase family protein/predicted transcriptional regulator
VSSEQKLIGTITDGDIRRGLLNGIDLEENVSLVMNTQYHSVDSQSSFTDVRSKMLKFKVRQMPILDKAGMVIGVHYLDNLNENFSRDNLFVVMAGGRGERLSNFTKTCPKPMLKIADKPILQLILEHAITEGFKNFVFSINYLGDQIEDYFGSGENFGVNISYLRESFALGTAGSLSLLSNKKGMPLVVTNGDVLSDISYSQMIDYHTSNEVLATIATRLFRWQHPFGVVESHDKFVTGYKEKPIIESQTNAGIYVLDESLISAIPRDTAIDMPEFLERTRLNGAQIGVYPLHEGWIDIGRPEDLAAARLDKVKGTPRENIID